MPRVLGVDIPNDKPTYISLQYLHGIGEAKAIEICRRLDLDTHRRARELSDDDIQRINSALDNEYVVEGQLRPADAGEHLPSEEHRQLPRHPPPA